MVLTLSFFLHLFTGLSIQTPSPDSVIYLHTFLSLSFFLLFLIPSASSSTFLLLSSLQTQFLPRPPVQSKPFSTFSLSPLFSCPNCSLCPSFQCSATVILRLISPPSVRLLDPLCLPASCPVIASVGGLTSLSVIHWWRQKVRKEKKDRGESKEKPYMDRIMISREI